MKQLILFIVCILPNIAYTVINELAQLDQSLQKINTLLLTTPTSKITTYEQLKTVVDVAYTNKNPSELDFYEQTVAVTTAKYLIQELIKEHGKPENRPAYIPLIAYITEQIVEQYPDKSHPLQCASLAAGFLENEFLLIRALRYVGYKTILLIAIDIMYDIQQGNVTKDTFKMWCDNRNIPISTTSLIKNHINLLLFQDPYNYMQLIYDNKLPKNYLFLMIQPTQTFGLYTTKDALLHAIEQQPITPNYLKFKNIENSEIKIYLPFKKSDFFISSPINQKKEIDNIEKVIKNWPDNQEYQKKLMTYIVTTFFDSTMVNGNIGSNVFLSFYDLIKHTALDATKLLAFETHNLEMKQITDMSGTLEQIYNRYTK